MQRPSCLPSLPSADNEAGHQEDEENDAPGDGHSQDGGLVWVPNSKNICLGNKNGTLIHLFLKKKKSYKGIRIDKLSPFGRRHLDGYVNTAHNKAAAENFLQQCIDFYAAQIEPLLETNTPLI